MVGGKREGRRKGGVGGSGSAESSSAADGRRSNLKLNSGAGGEINHEEKLFEKEQGAPRGGGGGGTHKLFSGLHSSRCGSETGHVLCSVGLCRGSCVTTLSHQMLFLMGCSSQQCAIVTHGQNTECLNH